MVQGNFTDELGQEGSSGLYSSVDAMCILEGKAKAVSGLWYPPPVAKDDTQAPHKASLKLDEHGVPSPPFKHVC